MRMRSASVFIFLLLSLGAFAQKAEIVKLRDIQDRIALKNGKIKVINFWATWCGPCVKELPLFEKLSKNRADVSVLLVSMDFDLDPDPEKVNRFIARRKIASEVLILQEKNPNEWIPQIDAAWTGSLPATLIVNSETGKKLFVEREFHEGELEKLIEQVNTNTN